MIEHMIVGLYYLGAEAGLLHIALYRPLIVSSIKEIKEILDRQAAAQVRNP